MTNFITITTPAKKSLHIRLASSFLSRLRGLLFTRPLGAQHGLLIVPCNSVHTVGMTYPIDVVFIDSKGVIVKINTQLMPWRMARCKQAYQTLELAAGQVAALEFELGLQLNLKKTILKTSFERTQSC